MEVAVPPTGPAVPDPTTTATLPPEVVRALAHGDWLSSWLTAAALAAVTVLLVVVAVARRRARRRTWPVAVAAGLVAVLGAGVGVNSAVGYVPDVAAARLLLAGQRVGPPADRPGTATTGAVEAVDVPAPADLGVANATTWVYLPPGYDPSRRYPVVYLVHGEPGTSADWLAGGDAAHTMDVLVGAGLVPPMILVMPDVNGRTTRDTECLDSTTGGPQVETYLTSVLVPWVDAHFATIADPEHRVLGGMSSGGFCALDVGLRHQDLFSTLLGIMPYAEPGPGGRQMLATEEQYDEHVIPDYLPDLSLPRPLAVFVDVPGDELASQEAEEARSVIAALPARGATVEYRSEPGQRHTWAGARVALPYALVFAAEHLPT